MFFFKQIDGLPNLKLVIFHGELLNNQMLYNNGEYIYIYILVGGWPTPLKNDGLSISWDDENPNVWKVIKIMFQNTNQIITVH